MAGYTRLNVREDVENMAPQFGMGSHLQARFAREALGLERTGMTYFRFGPGYRMPFGHNHRRQEEVYVVVSGSARIKVEDEVVELGPWDAIRVAPEATRNLESGEEGAEVLAFGEAAGREDSEMIAGWWIE